MAGIVGTIPPTSICLSLNWFTVLSFASRGDFIAERGSNWKGRGGNSKQYRWAMLGALKQEHSIELMPVHLARTALLECPRQGEGRGARAAGRCIAVAHRDCQLQSLEKRNISSLEQFLSNTYSRNYIM